MAISPANTGRAMKHAQITPAVSVSQRVMRRAHTRASTMRCTLAEALRQSWAIEKGLSAVDHGAVLVHRDALAKAMTPAASLAPPPTRQSPQTHTKTHAPRRQRKEVAPRQDLTDRLGDTLVGALNMIGVWVKAGRPELTSAELWAVGQIAEGCINLMDASLPDPDLEPSLGSRETVGNEMIFRSGLYPDGVYSTERGNQQDWSGGLNDDRESDNECDFEDGADDEPSLGSINPRMNAACHGEKFQDGINQTHWGDLDCNDLEEGDDNGIGDAHGRSEQITRSTFKRRTNPFVINAEPPQELSSGSNLRIVSLPRAYINRPLTKR